MTSDDACQTPEPLPAWGIPNDDDLDARTVRRIYKISSQWRWWECFFAHPATFLAKDPRELAGFDLSSLTVALRPPTETLIA